VHVDARVLQEELEAETHRDRDHELRVAVDARGRGGRVLVAATVGVLFGLSGEDQAILRRHV